MLLLKYVLIHPLIILHTRILQNRIMFYNENNYLNLTDSDILLIHSILVFLLYNHILYIELNTFFAFSRQAAACISDMAYQLVYPMKQNHSRILVTAKENSAFFTSAFNDIAFLTFRTSNTNILNDRFRVPAIRKS